MTNSDTDLVSAVWPRDGRLVCRDIFLFARLPTDCQIPLTR